MCRLLGFAAPSATTLFETIGDIQCASFLDMSRLHADGWGSAWISEVGGAHLKRIRDTVPAQEALRSSGALDTDVARARIVHLRMATAGMTVAVENSHPFLTEGIAFAHNGAVTPVASLRRLLDSAFLEGVEGGTDSELYFALIRQNLATGASLYEATRATVARLRELFPAASLNCLLLTENELIAVHSNEGARTPLAEFRASGLSDEDLPLDHLEHYYQMSYLRLDDGTTAFTSAGIDTSGWHHMPPASIASVDLQSLNFRLESVQGAPLDS